MQPPIASPHPEPQRTTVEYPATLTQWVYALICVGLCVLILFPVFHATRDYIQYGMVWRDCGTGQPTGFDVSSAAFWWALPVAQFWRVRKAPWGKAPLQLMRSATLAVCAVMSALLVGLSLMSYAVHR